MGHDCHLVDGIGGRSQPSNYRVSTFVIGNHAPFAGIHQLRMSRTHPDLVLTLFKIRHGNSGVVMSRRGKRRLVAKVGQVRSAHAYRAARESGQIYIAGESEPGRVDAQDTFAPYFVRKTNHNLTTETSRAQQRWIENIGSIGRRENDDLDPLVKTVEL